MARVMQPFIGSHSADPMYHDLPSHFGPSWRKKVQKPFLRTQQQEHSIWQAWGECDVLQNFIFFRNCSLSVGRGVLSPVLLFCVCLHLS